MSFCLISTTVSTLECKGRAVDTMQTSWNSHFEGLTFEYINSVQPDKVESSSKHTCARPISSSTTLCWSKLMIIKLLKREGHFSLQITEFSFDYIRNCFADIKKKCIDDIKYRSVTTCLSRQNSYQFSHWLVAEQRNGKWDAGWKTWQPISCHKAFSIQRRRVGGDPEASVAKASLCSPVILQSTGHAGGGLCQTE